MLATLYKEFKSSIKSPDTEEKLDLFFYRPFGFIIAKISHQLKLTPTMLSLIGLGCGIVASYFFLFPDEPTSLVAASLLYILSGVFDSADGQLARLSNQSTKLGLILDGICDSLVAIVIYLTCSWQFMERFGIYFIFIMLIALHLHSLQCAILDFYHREYLYFGYGKTENDTYWNPDLEDCKAIIQFSANRVEKMMNRLRLTWIKKQQQLCTRTAAQRTKLREILLNSDFEKKEKIMRIYRKHNLWILPYWRLVGVNAHSVLLIGFMFFNRFDLYLILFDIIIFNIVIGVVAIMQKRSDQLMFKELEKI